MKYLIWALFVLFTTSIEAHESFDPMHIALVRRIDPGTGLADLARQQEKADERALEIEHFLRKLSHYRWEDVQVKGFVLASDCEYDYPWYCQDEIEKMVPDMTTETFIPEYFNIWVPWRASGPYCGMAPLGGHYSITYGGCTAGTNVHEHFHNLGLHHAMKNGGEYGDSTSILGRSDHQPGLNAQNMLKLGLNWTEPVVITSSTEVLISPIELKPDALHDGEVQYVIINPDIDEPVYLSLRKNKGYPYIAYTNKPGSLYVHIYGIAGEEMRKTNWINTLYVGDAWAKNSRITIEYLEYKNETARVAIIIDGEPVPEELVIEEDLPEPVTTVDPFHAGLWYNPEFPGQGFDIQVRDGRIAITWFVYNGRNNSATRWYIASGDMYDHEYDLYTTDGEVLIEAGSVQLHFFDESTGIIHYNTPEHGRGSIPVQSLLFAPDSGLWHDPDIELEGFSGHFYDDDKVILYWFTSGHRPRNIVTTGVIYKQRWFMMMGSKVGDEYHLDVYEATGGSFLMFDDVDIIRVGTGILYSNMELELDIQVEAFSEPDKVLKLRRLL